MGKNPVLTMSSVVLMSVPCCCFVW